MNRSKGAILGAFVTSLVLIAAGCQRTTTGGGGTAGELKAGGQIAYAQDQEQTGFNNLTSKDNLLELRNIMRQVWPYAYITKPDFTLEPYVLDGPAKVLSQDPFTVEWKIKKDASWEDGTPISSDDFEYNYNMCSGKDAKADCASTSGYDLITKFEKVDGKTVRATFAEPYAEFEGLFGDPMPPVHIAKQRNANLTEAWNTGFDSDPGISGGPYKVKEWVRGDHTTLVRNDKFWGEKPRLDTIIFRAIPDVATHTDALRNDEVQLIYPDPLVDVVQQIQAIPGVTMDVNFGPTWEHIDFNFKNELLAIKEVRQAITYGIDRDAIVNALMKPISPRAKRLDNRIFVNGQKGYEAHGKEYAKRDVAKATAAMEKAGFKKGADGVYAKDGKRASFRIRYKQPNPQREQLSQLVQNQLKEAGIEIKIDPYGDPLSTGKVGSQGDFDLLLFAWVGTPFPASGLHQIFTTGSDSNFGQYGNPGVDRLSRLSGAEVDQDKRFAMLNEVDQAMWEDLPNIPIFQRPVGILAYSNKYANIKDNTTSEGIFWNSPEWGLKATAS
ncbi:MAG: ABC transporter family substrate-binding protein [Actinomycetota bacterium]